MSIKIQIAENSDAKKWDDAVLTSPHSTIYHTFAWLKIAEKQSQTRLYPLMVYNEKEFVAIYPFFIKIYGVIKMGFSPAPNTNILYLGPAFLGYDQLKQNKKEALYFNVLKAVDAFLYHELKCKYVKVRTSPGLLDYRPFYWQGYTVKPHFTYRIRLTEGTEHVWEQFDRKLRVDINKAIREGVTITTGRKEDLDFFHNALVHTLIDHGLKPVNQEKYLSDCYDAFSPDYLKIFLAKYQGKTAGGLIVLKFKDVAYQWIGVPKSDLRGISPNDLVQWEAIQWAFNNGCTYYEEMDTGNYFRLIFYKAKYNPDLEIWYSGYKHFSKFTKTAQCLRNCLTDIFK